MTKPIVGSMVHFTPGLGDGIPQLDQPLAATIAYVYNDREVSLTVSDVNGNTHGRLNVPLLQDGDEAPSDPDTAYCWWPDDRDDQAAKGDVPETQIAGLVPAGDDRLSAGIFD